VKFALASILVPTSNFVKYKIKFTFLKIKTIFQTRCVSHELHRRKAGFRVSNVVAKPTAHLKNPVSEKVLFALGVLKK